MHYIFATEFVNLTSPKRKQRTDGCHILRKLVWLYTPFLDAITAGEEATSSTLAT